jgi:hypothetical protein
MLKKYYKKAHLKIFFNWDKSEKWLYDPFLTKNIVLDLNKI